ncbi:TetR/AcrR family transcriptional regulator [Rhodococcus sp. OK302]|uniref:TetR/AcrR family transcriptional regulator n=1 Tax=Rhodococcus sp. OK302 TaxID=1882769 RepID=UPI000B93A4C6|nr:TetR/AcrR family transcriptional regulator [Rhodococcus sp. OK302]OYD67161.1 TetR family transcriptional regulator [Rhodococcus sp. OK302]
MTLSKGAARAAAILDAAEEVLITAGNAHSAMRDFAAAAGIRVGHLQHYFPTRADLIRAIMSRALERSLARLTATTNTWTEAASDTQITRADSERLILVLLSEQEDPATVRLYVEVWSLASVDTEIAAVVRDFYRQYVAHVARIVARAQPDLDSVALRGRAESVVSVLEGSSVLRSGIADLRSESTDAILVQTLQYLIHGS